MVLENESLRKKLLMLRDENSHLVSQNHKLLNELEGTSCDLHQSRLKVCLFTINIISSNKIINKL